MALGDNVLDWLLVDPTIIQDTTTPVLELLDVSPSRRRAEEESAWFLAAVTPTGQPGCCCCDNCCGIPRIWPQWCLPPYNARFELTLTSLDPDSPCVCSEDGISFGTSLTLTTIDYPSLYGNKCGMCSGCNNRWGLWKDCAQIDFSIKHWGALLTHDCSRTDLDVSQRFRLLVSTAPQIQIPQAACVSGGNPDGLYGVIDFGEWTFAECPRGSSRSWEGVIDNWMLLIGGVFHPEFTFGSCLAELVYLEDVPVP